VRAPGSPAQCRPRRLGLCENPLRAVLGEQRPPRNGCSSLPRLQVRRLSVRTGDRRRAGHPDAPRASEPRQLPALIPPRPAWSALPQIPKGHGNKRQVAGCPPRQQSCSVFCRERFVSLLFSADCVSLLKTARSGRQPPSLSPSLCFSPPAFPFLVISVATQICEKRLAFYRHPLPSTVLLSVFVG